jgi:dienelactone hydrolase
MRTLGLAALVVALAGCGGDDAPDPFAYDADQPLALRVADEQQGGGVSILDASYAAAGGTVSAFVVRPEGPGPFPVVLFQHGGGSTRADFLEEAAALAERGAVGILVQAPDRPSVRSGVVANVVAWRRALDWVGEQQFLDPKRVAFVGISYGAAIGADLAGADHRVGRYVLMSGPPRWRGSDADDLAPERWIANADDARFLFQLGRLDHVVPPAEGQELVDAAPGPKETRRYAAGHVLDAQAQQERVAWLSAVLGLG